MFVRALLAVTAALSFVPYSTAHPGHENPSIHEILARGAQTSADTPSASPFSASKFPAIQEILQGNERFKTTTRNATLLAELVENGQKPPVMMVSCSDSRVPESDIFDAQPGTFFMERNIANQYKPGDENAQSVMAYGVHVLGVQHLVIMGHYGCGGVAASIASAPKNDITVASHLVQTWIGDIRQLYLSSDRAEVVEMRNRNLAIEASGGTVPEPEIRDPGFRAMVEENVKQQVKRISESSVIKNLNEEVIVNLNPDGSPKTPESSVEKRAEEEAPLIPVFVHGWVHDMETGEVIDLNVSTGPAGFENFTPSSTSSETETPSDETTPSEPASSPEPTPLTEAPSPIVEDVAPINAAPELSTASEDVRVHGSHVLEGRMVRVRRDPFRL